MALAPAAPAEVVASAVVPNISWTTYTAGPADALVDTIGVAIHKDYGDTSYGRHDVLAMLQRLGIRQIRDGANRSSMPFYREFVDRAGPGAGVSYVVDDRGEGGVRTQLEMIADLAPGTASQIESSNEPDCDGWSPGEVEAYHRRAVEMRAIMDTLPELSGVPLTTPSFCVTSAATYAAYGDDGVSERFNMHPYLGGHLPEREIGRILSAARAADPDAVPVITEGGFHSAVRADDPHMPTSEAAQTQTSGSRFELSVQCRSCGGEFVGDRAGVAG